MTSYTEETYIGFENLILFIITKALISITFNAKRSLRALNIKTCSREAIFMSVADSLGNNI